MKISELIERLELELERHGDINVCYELELESEGIFIYIDVRELGYEGSTEPAYVVIR